MAQRPGKGERSGGRQWLAAVVLCCLLPAAGAEIDLAALSIEQLLEIDVTVAMRREAPLRDTPAAVYVLRAEDIRRSGATSIPELLRLVPGVEVGRISAGKWAVSIRGFNTFFANKLLVLIDGRTAYSPVFSGVFWDAQDVPLVDIERIEVVRGPGAALWGSNAVNGVINIVTRPAAATTGGLLEMGGGDEERRFANLRYGAALGEAGHLRAYIKGFDRDDTRLSSGGDNFDDWQGVQGGLRWDSAERNGGQWTLQLDSHDSDQREELVRPRLTPPFFDAIRTTIEYHGSSALLRWQRRHADGSGQRWQIYADRSERDDTLFLLDIDVIDADFQHNFALGQRQQLVWGLGYRQFSDDIRPGRFGLIRFAPERDRFALASAFVQNDISLLPQRLNLLLGTKLEDHDFGPLVLQPNLRLLFTPAADTRLWAAISRAVRRPSRAERHSFIDVAVDPLSAPLPILLQIQGRENYGHERLLAYEAGLRHRFSPVLELDLALFYNDYNELRTFEPEDPQLQLAPVPHLLVPLAVSNGADAVSRGGELLLKWQWQPRWQLELSYAYLDLDVDPDPGSGDTSARDPEGESARHRVVLRSLWQLPWQLELDAALRHVSKLPTPAIDRYTELDLRLGKRFGDQLELSLVGQNLLDDQHEEAVLALGAQAPRAGIERGAYLKLTLEF